MGRLIVIAAIVFAIWWLFRNRSRLQPPSRTPSAPGGTMKPCAHCGTYMPMDRAIAKDGLYFCDSAHLLAWEKEKRQ